MSIRSEAAEMLAAVKKEAAAAAQAKKAKIESAEELAERLDDLNAEKDSINAVVEKHIKELRDAEHAAKEEVDREIRNLVHKNSRFAEEAVKLMSKAAEATGNVRKISLKGVGRGLGWLRDAATQIGKEIQEGMDR